MGYKTEFDTKSGGTWPTMPKGGKPPQGQWTGEYVTPIKYRGDGQQAVDPAPQQGFRKELPNPSKPNYATSEYDPAEQPTQAEIYRKHR